ncbi:MAG TPA: CotH kinase family protein [Chloroflexota bacterium]|nr:CotH kinase family protein [Chloroflexota bacterium]
MASRRRVVLAGCAALGGLLAAACAPFGGPTAPPTPAPASSAPPLAPSGPGITPAPGQPGVLAAPPLRGARTVDEVLSPDLAHVIDVVVLDPSRLPLLDLDREAKIDCDVTIDGTRYTGARIKEKGSIGSSSNLDGKPGFTITFGKDNPKGMDKLTLNNARQDASFLHEHLAYDLYRRAGLAAPRTTHGAVTLNGKPYGVFVMVEPFDDPFLERTFDSDKGNLYEGNAPGELTENVDNPLVLELKDEDKGKKRDDVRALAAAIAAPEGQFETEVRRLLDLDRFIAALALDGLLAHWDGPMFNNNNYYLYANPRDGGRFVLMPHGADQVFDVGFDPLQEPKALIARRVRATPSLETRLRNDLNRIMGGVWDVAALLDRMGRVGTNLREIAMRDTAVARDVAQFEATFESMRVQVIERKSSWTPR